ncbi:MAG: hypothetical protein Q8R48_01930 [Candidatus Omnitrophota bacterium]|nr:hypothetical protein [Candidatus Omnitrophota bacterium]
MASGIYNRFKANLMKKDIDLEVDTIKVMLLSSSHAFNPDHNLVSQISANEITGTGYTAGGAALANKTVTQDDTNDKAKWDADDVSWQNSTITARFAVLYDANNNLIACIDFAEDKSSSSGEFKIQWHADGIVTLS